MVALMHVFMSKINGQSKLKLPPKALNFYIACASLYRKTFDMMSDNLLGPALRSVQRVDAKSHGSTIIECDSATIKERIKMRIKIIREDLIKRTPNLDPVIEFSLGFDVTKVLASIKVDHANKAVVGGLSAADFIDIRGKTDA